MNQGEMSVSAVLGTPPAPGLESQRFEKGIGPSDLREYIDLIEGSGELRRITAEVDPIEEMSAIVYLAAHEIGAPAFLFENVKGDDSPVLWNIWGSSANRMAIAMGVPTGLSHRDLVMAIRTRLGLKIAPVTIDSAKAPIFANTVTDDDIDVYRFP